MSATQFSTNGVYQLLSWPLPTFIIPAKSAGIREIGLSH